MCKCSEPVWVRRSKYPLLLLMTSDWEMSVSLSSLVLLLCAADLTMLTFIFRSNKVELNWLTDACWYTGWLMGVGALVDWWVLVHWLTDGCIVVQYINSDLIQKIQAYDPTASDELIAPSIIEEYLKGEKLSVLSVPLCHIHSWAASALLVIHSHFKHTAVLWSSEVGETILEGATHALSPLFCPFLCMSMHSYS